MLKSAENAFLNFLSSLFFQVGNHNGKLIFSTVFD
ncbi:hypothetical protein CF65_02268 [Aggregatibacter actinomycetemcomitans HK1651]|nr:hypothetical protein CF65_02268 [Aggregatibacter actinomycetemcomitans HK1651]